MKKSMLIVFVLLILQPAFSFTSFSARAFVSVAVGRSDSIVKGEFVLHSTAGYNWWSYVPTSLSQQDLSYLLLEESHPQLEDYAGLTTTAVYSLLPYRSFAEAHRFILVLVVLPRKHISHNSPTEHQLKRRELKDAGVSN